MGRRVTDAVGRLLDRRVGRKLVTAAAVARPDVLLAALGWSLSREHRFSRVETWPDAVSAFEDVAPLVLASNAANRGLAAMSLVETAHLWRVAREAGEGTLIEIGRERGGSTFVLAAAMAEGAKLISYDPQSKLGGPEFDHELSGALARYRLHERVEVSSESSHEATPPAGEYALVLVDGDPSYEGTRLDFERFGRRLRLGGRLLFHDAVAGGPRQPQLARLLRELETEPELERLPDVGTFADFVRR